MQSMSDDPRQILAEAGVECAEVEAWERLANTKLMTKRKMASVPATGDAAILALARLVAVKHKAALELAERATGTKWADYHDLGIGEDPEGIVAYLTEKHSGEWKLYYDWDADHA